MSTHKIRWSKVYESSEEELVTFLQNRNIKSRRIAAEEHAEQKDQVSEKDFTLWCAEGSLLVHQQGKATSMQPGDAMGFAAAQPYDLIAGMTGYVCYVSD